MNKTGCCPVRGDMMDKNNEEIDASLKRAEERKFFTTKNFLLTRYKREEWK